MLRDVRVLCGVVGSGFSRRVLGKVDVEGHVTKVAGWFEGMDDMKGAMEAAGKTC